VEVTLEQEGVSDENMCNGHGTHGLTSVLSRQRGSRRVTVQHLRERHVIVVGQRLRCCMCCYGWEDRDMSGACHSCHRWLPSCLSV